MPCSTNLVDECNKSCEEGKKTGSSRLRPKRPFLLKRKKTITSTEYDKLIHHITYLKILFTILNLLYIFVTVITIPCKMIRKQKKIDTKKQVLQNSIEFFFTTSCVVPIASCFLDGWASYPPTPSPASSKVMEVKVQMWSFQRSQPWVAMWRCAAQRCNRQMQTDISQCSHNICRWTPIVLLQSVTGCFRCIHAHSHSMLYGNM